MWEIGIPDALLSACRQQCHVKAYLLAKICCCVFTKRYVLCTVVCDQCFPCQSKVVLVCDQVLPKAAVVDNCRGLTCSTYHAVSHEQAVMKLYD